MTKLKKRIQDVFNALLQIMDDGRITDSQGRTVNFKNTIIIMTSNIGSQHLTHGICGDTISEPARQAVMTELRQGFRPEFINRIDDIVLFKPLALEQIEKIVDLQLLDLNHRLESRMITVSLNKEAKKWAAEKGYDSIYGARPLKRFIQKQIENKMAKNLIEGKISEGQAIQFILKDEALEIE